MSCVVGGQRGEVIGRHDGSRFMILILVLKGKGSDHPIEVPLSNIPLIYYILVRKLSRKLVTFKYEYTPLA